MSLGVAEKLESAQVKKMVDQVWQTRLASGDPLEALLHTAQVSMCIPSQTNCSMLAS